MPGPLFLRGESVELHTIESEDVQFLAETINDPAVRRSLSRTEPVSLAQEEEWLESHRESDDVHLLITANGDPVGTIGLHHLNDRMGVAEVGYSVAPDAQGQGIATDATRTVVRYAFEEVGLHRVSARAFATNEASQRVLEKVGFEREGVSREEAFVGGERVDTVRFGLLAEDWDR